MGKVLSATGSSVGTPGLHGISQEGQEAEDSKPGSGLPPHQEYPSPSAKGPWRVLLRLAALFTCGTSGFKTQPNTSKQHVYKCDETDIDARSITGAGQGSPDRKGVDGAIVQATIQPMQHACMHHGQADKAGYTSDFGHAGQSQEKMAKVARVSQRSFVRASSQSQRSFARPSFARASSCSNFQKPSMLNPNYDAYTSQLQQHQQGSSNRTTSTGEDPSSRPPSGTLQARTANGRTSNSGSGKNSSDKSGRSWRGGMIAAALAVLRGASFKSSMPSMAHAQSLSPLADPETGELKQAAVVQLSKGAKQVDIPAAAKSMRRLSWVGKGTSGVVYEATWQGRPVAVKFIVSRDELPSLSATATEGFIFKAVCNHPNIVKCINWQVTRLTAESFMSSDRGSPNTPNACTTLVLNRQISGKNWAACRKGRDSESDLDSDSSDGSGGDHAAAPAAPAAAAEPMLVSAAKRVSPGSSSGASNGAISLALRSRRPPGAAAPSLASGLASLHGTSASPPHPRVNSSLLASGSLGASPPPFGLAVLPGLSFAERRALHRPGQGAPAGAAGDAMPMVLVMMSDPAAPGHGGLPPIFSAPQLELPSCDVAGGSTEGAPCTAGGSKQQRVQQQEQQQGQASPGGGQAAMPVPAQRQQAAMPAKAQQQLLQQKLETGSCSSRLLASGSASQSPPWQQQQSPATEAAAMAAHMEQLAAQQAIHQVLAQLGAKPGDYFTQIVMELCDNSLNRAIANGMFRIQPTPSTSGALGLDAHHLAHPSSGSLYSVRAGAPSAKSGALPGGSHTEVDTFADISRCSNGGGSGPQQQPGAWGPWHGSAPVSATGSLWRRSVRGSANSLPGPAPANNREAGLAALLRAAREIAEALSHVHGLSVIHGDLKPSNVMLALAEDGEWVAKLCDFGSAKLIPAGADCVGGPTSVGTIAYAAPEALKGTLRKESDVWSFGVLLHQMVTGRPPYQSLNAGQILMGVVQASVSLTWPPWCPAQLAALGVACLSHDHAARPTCKKIVGILAALEDQLLTEPESLLVTCVSSGCGQDGSSHHHSAGSMHRQYMRVNDSASASITPRASPWPYAPNSNTTWGSIHQDRYNNNQSLQSSAYAWGGMGRVNGGVLSSAFSSTGGVPPVGITASAAGGDGSVSRGDAPGRDGSAMLFDLIMGVNRSSAGGGEYGCGGWGRDSGLSRSSTWVGHQAPAAPAASASSAGAHRSPSLPAVRAAAAAAAASQMNTRSRSVPEIAVAAESSADGPSVRPLLANGAHACPPGSIAAAVVAAAGVRPASGHGLPLHTAMGGSGSAQ